jgi:hypothetical protein
LKTYTIRLMNMFESVDQFGKKPELTLTPKLTGLFTQVTTHLGAMRNWAAGQTTDNGDLREGAAEKRNLASEIYGVLRDIREIAKGLEIAGDVGLTENFRLPATRAYAKVLASARSFVANVTPISADFIASGMPATFVADLEAKITAFETATGAKSEGLTDRVGSTAVLDVAAAAGLKAVQQLRGIMRVHLRATPELLAGWKSAARVATSSQKKAATEPAAPAPAGPVP